MRSVCALALTFAALLDASSARAQRPDPALAFFAGASVFLAGFAVGGALLATSQSSDRQNNAGWLTIESGFGAAPLIAHGLAGEWVRGAVFAAVPAASAAGTATLFAMDPGAISQGALPEQRVMWSFFGIGLLSSAAGVIDCAFAGTRTSAVAIAPVFGTGQVGVNVRGSL